MKHINKVINTVVLGALLCAGRAQADITVTFDMNGLTGIDPNDTVLVLADTLGNGFGGDNPGAGLVGDLTFATHPGLVLSQWTPSSDDQVLYVGSAGQANQFLQDVNFSLAGNLGNGDQLLVVYFPTTPYTSQTGPGENQAFGYYRDNLGNLTGDTGFTAPSDGFGGSLIRAAGTDGYPASLSASFQTIPEPSSAMLVLCGLGLARIIRRRHNNS